MTLAADYATSHIQQLTAARTYSRAISQALALPRATVQLVDDEVAGAAVRDRYDPTRPAQG
jgi:hypothetical protein